MITEYLVMVFHHIDVPGLYYLNGNSSMCYILLLFSHNSLKDIASLTSFFQNTCGITPEEKQLSVSGRNWGEVDLNGL